MKLTPTRTATTAANNILRIPLLSLLLGQLMLMSLVNPFNPTPILSTTASPKIISTMSGTKKNHDDNPDPSETTQAKISTIGSAASSSSSSAAAAPKIDRKEAVASTKWLALETWHYTDQEGKQRLWDVATRTTKPKVAKDAPPSTPGNTRSTADAVVIIPILKSKKKKKTTRDGGPAAGANVLETILVEQFRPPLQQNTMEFPAGLVDAGETVEQCALRELREETGYTGTIIPGCGDVSRAVCMSPGLATETVHVVMVSVDLDAEINQNPKTQLDDGEYVTIHRTELNEGLKTLLDTHPSMPIMGLYLFALGFQLGSDNAVEGAANAAAEAAAEAASQDDDDDDAVTPSNGKKQKI